MITKISMANSMELRNFNTVSVSFKGYDKTYEDIKIISKEVNLPISTMSGDIDIRTSTVNGKISDMSGDISVLSSTINGNIKNLSGDIAIKQANIAGNIENISGDTLLHSSLLKGNISSTGGDIVINNSTVDGIVKSMAENIQLKGENKIKELVIVGAKKGPEKSEADVKAELAKQGIFIHGKIGHINNTSGMAIINNFNLSGQCKTTFVEPSLEFNLPIGSKIDTIRFDSDKQGVVLIEKGRRFCGKIINGAIKKI